MACVNCAKIRAAILHGKMAEAAGLSVQALREKFGIETGSRAASQAPADPDPLDQSIPALTAYLGGVTDPAHVDELIAAENAGKTRRGALDALAVRRAELAG